MTAEPISGTDVADTSKAKTAATKRRLRIEDRLGLPERPTTARRDEMGGWMAEAVCAGRGDLGLTEVDRQADAAEIITMFCDRCPVADACLAEGRTAHGSGIYGGLVLDDGALARDTATLADAFRDPSVWLAPPPTLEVVPAEFEPTKTAEFEPTKTAEFEPTKGAGQRWQPKRSSRARRRGARR